MKDQCPFAVAVPVAAPEAPKASFAANWYVSGIGQLAGADFVSIKSRDHSTQFSLFGGEADRNTGVTLVSVKWQDGVGKSTVVLKKGSETANLEFNEAEVHGVPPPTATANPAANGKATAAAGAVAKAAQLVGANHPPQPLAGGAPIAAVPQNFARNPHALPAASFNRSPNVPTGPSQPGNRRVVVPQIQTPQ